MCKERIGCLFADKGTDNIVGLRGVELLDTESCVT